jgi:hypothetical protein
MTNQSAPLTGETVRERLRPMLVGRPVVLTGGTLASFTRLVPLVTDLSGRRPFALAEGIGTGPLPADGDIVTHLLPDTGATDMMSAIRATIACLADPPADAVAALDAWDPDRRAVVLAGSLVTTRELAGRPVLDGRPHEWEVLEDKTTVDALWDDIGVRRAPSRVVGTSYDELVGAARDVTATGGSTVWSGDVREGFNGGSEYVRWVRTEQDSRTAADFFGAHCDTARVMPFLDGIPCSVHGVVLPDGVAALRPVEMVVLRGGNGGGFLNAGISTHWDPPAADRVEMRDIARRVAAWLRDRHGFRGGFSVDGVMTRDGFLPTELNSRFSAGLMAIARAVPDIPLLLVQTALVSGHDPGMTARELEDLLTSAADRQRTGGGGLVTNAVHPAETDTRKVLVDGGRVRLADDPDLAHGELMLGPSTTGGYLRFEPRADLVVPGTSLAPMVVSALALADELWGLGIGPTEPAHDVRAV